MRVGTVCKLKVECLANKPGTLGVVYFNYGDGVQVIFENGRYDGFSTSSSALTAKTRADRAMTEAEQFLQEVGFEDSLAGYQFKNVMQVVEDYRKGLFNIVWSEKSKEPVVIEDCVILAAEADAVKAKSDIEEYCGFDVCAELRRLAEKQEPKDETVLLPGTKPSLWWDSTVDVEFEKVEISKLLQFIADMIE